MRKIPTTSYLSDFGITKHTTSRSGLTATGEFMGTIDYISPEQIEGRPVDGHADMYLLACVRMSAGPAGSPSPKTLMRRSSGRT